MQNIDYYNKLKNKYPKKFSEISEILSNFTDQEICMIIPYVLEIETPTCFDYTILPKISSVLHGLNLFKEISALKLQNAVNGILPKLKTVNFSETVEMVPGPYIIEVTFIGIPEIFQVETCEEWA